MPRRLLALESATDWLSIALAEDDDVVLLREAERTRQHSAELLPLLHAARAELGDARADRVLAPRARAGAATAVMRDEEARGGRAALRRLRSHDEVEHDAHFAHYLDGLLDDLVAWKKRRVDYPALSTTA